MAEPLGQFISKWGAAPPTTSVEQTLMDLDQQRVAVGKAPLTADQTYAAMQAASTRQPFTPQPTENPLAIWSNITRDITNLVRGIPKLPSAMIGLGRDIISDPFGIPEGGNIADMPVAQPLPGAFVASAILPGGVPAGELATRPVTTALDILPFASKGVNLVGEEALRTVDPAAKFNSYQTALRLKDQLAATRGIGIDADTLTPVQRMGVQGAIATGEGRRLIPDLLSKRIYADDMGRGYVSDRMWQVRGKQNPLTRELFKFSPTVRNVMSGLRKDESTMVTEAQVAEIPLAAREWSHRFHEFYGDQDTSAAKLETLNDVLADPAAFGVRTPDEAMTVVAKDQPDLVPFFEDAKKLLDRLNEQEFNTPDRWGDPVVAKYKDGNVYTHAEVNRLTSADTRLAAAQGELAKANQRVIGNITRRLTKSYGAEVMELVRVGDEEAAKALLRSNKVSAPTKTVRAIAQANEIEKRIAWMSEASLDDLVRYGVPERLTPSHLGELKLLTPEEWRVLTDRYAKARVQARKRIRLWEGVRPASEAATASRIIWENYQKNLDVASKEMPAKYGIERWDEYKRRFREIQHMDPKLRAQRKRALREELGNDYRYLHYIVPDDAAWQNYSGNLLRQNMNQQLLGNEGYTLIEEAQRSLAQMSLESPYAPAYVPRVRMEDAGRIDNTSVRASYMKPDHAKARSYDYAPMHPDLGVSVAYTSLMDHMARRGIPYMVDRLSKHPSMLTESELNAMLRAEYDTLRASGRTDITDDFRRYLNDAKNDPRAKRYIKFEPSELFPSSRPTRTDLDQLWMPVELESVVRSAVEDAMSPKAFSKLLDPVTGLFRTSVLLFSPAWHWNNIMSNMMITAMTNPAALKRIPEQWRQMGGGRGLRRYVKETDIAESGLETSLRGEALDGDTLFTPQMLRAGFPGVLGALEQFTLRLHRSAGKEFIEHGLARSRTGIRIWDQIRHSDSWEKMAGGLERAAGASLGFNSFFDDMARRANFEQFYDDAFDALKRDYATTHGRPPRGAALDNLENVASERALLKTQDWLMDWTQMLPIERSFLRSIFPFYSFTAHIMRAALKFPFDHPVRVAVINALTRAEEEDWASRYPPVFRQLLGAPNPDDSTEWTGLNVHSFNPFRDVGNMLTLAGILGATNPIMTTAFEQLGIDILRGGPEYAPNFIYDPLQPGGERFDSGNPVINLAGNLVPQARTIAMWAGMDEGYRELQRRDPAAANRMLLTGLRLPTVWRTIDVEEAVAKDEIKRFNDASDAISQLDVGNVERYFPQLAPIVAEKKRRKEVRDATAGQLASHLAGRPSPYHANPLSAFVTV